MWLFSAGDTMKDTATLLEKMAEVIAAVAPSGSIGKGDVFRVKLEDSNSLDAGRDVRVTALAARQRFPGKTFSDWETQVDITVVYPDVQTASGAKTTTQRALSDCELILVALYQWAATGADGVTRIDADLGNVFIDQGFTHSTRTVRIEYTRD